MKILLIPILILLYINCLAQNVDYEPIKIEINNSTKAEIFSYYADVSAEQSIVSIYFDLITEDNNTDILKYINFLNVNNEYITPYYTTVIKSQDNNYSGILLYIVDANSPKIKWHLSVNSKGSEVLINFSKYLNLQNLNTPKTLMRKLETLLVLANYNFNLENKGKFISYAKIIDTVKFIKENMGSIYPYWIYMLNKELTEGKKIGEGNTVAFLDKALELGCNDTTVIRNYFYYLKTQADLFYNKDLYDSALNYYTKIDSILIENQQFRNKKLTNTSALDSVKFYKLFCNYVLNIDQILEKNEDIRKVEVKQYIQKFIPYENKPVKYHAFLVLGNLNYYNKNYGDAEEYYNKIIDSPDPDAKQFVNSANECKSNIPKN